MLYKNKYRIETTRLKAWDYTNPWWYFVTINAKNHVRYFGEVVNDKMILNELGMKAAELWNNIPKHYSVVELDYYVVMPNHLHGIVIINDASIVETGYLIGTSIPSPNVQSKETPCMTSLQQQKKISLSTIISTYKAAVSRWCNQNDLKFFSWQPRFYDRIIRNEKELYKIRKYIEENPLQWELERNVPENMDLL